MKMLKFITLFLVFLNFSLVYSFENEVKESKLTERQRPKTLINIKTKLGNLIGYKKEVLNRTVNIFYGVPYAEPPIGKFRFRKTKLIKKFPQNPYNALDFKAHCARKKPAFANVNDKYSEDCLYLNIYTPNLESRKCNEKYQVMIYIIGGKGSMYQMSPFLDSNGEGHIIYNGELFPALHNTILITLNYRQDLFATLYVENKLNGNLGLFDQNLVLRWAKEYINDFCGNDENLTLLGHSYGAMAVSLHLISKYSKDLISNAILLSGSGLFRDVMMTTMNEQMINSLLAIDQLGCINYTDSKIDEHIDELDERTRSKFFRFVDEKYLLNKKRFLTELSKNHYKFGSKLKAGNDNIDKDDYIDSKVLRTAKLLSKYSIDLECLQNLPSEKVIEVDESFLNIGFKDHYDFDFIDTEAFLDYKIFNKLNLNPKVNILAGVLANEAGSNGLFLKDKYYTDQFNAPNIPKEDAKELIKELNYLRTTKKGFKQYMADFYTNETKWTLSNGYYDSFTNCVADQVYYCPLYFFTKYAALTANSVSSYQITYRTTKHLWHEDQYAWTHGFHSDECNYLFGLPWRVPNQFSDLDREFSIELIELFTSFAKDGKMRNLSNGQKWPTSNKHHPKPRYVEINNCYLREWTFDFHERCELFWAQFLSSYKR